MQIVLSCVCLLLLYQTSQAERSVLERGLVVTDPQWKDIVKEERRYCQQTMTKHRFQGPVLGYITPVSAVLDFRLELTGAEFLHLL